MHSHQFVKIKFGWNYLKQLLTLIFVIDKALKNNDSVDCIYLHFCKAFDSVSHSKLLLKLLNFGFYGPGFKRICPHVDSVSVLKILCEIFFLSWVVCFKAALLVHCSSLFILMTFQLVVACHRICSYLLMTPNVLTGYPLLLIVWYFRKRLMILLGGVMSGIWNLTSARYLVWSLKKVTFLCHIM